MPRNLRLSPIATCLYFALTGPLLAAPSCQRGRDDPACDRERHGFGQFRRRVSERPEKFQSADGRRTAIGSPARVTVSATPMGAAGFGMYGGMTSESGIQARAASAGPGGYNGRPGYEVRVLMASANILARHGQQQPCEDVLTATRGLYKSYLSDMQHDRVPPFDVQQWHKWRHRQITAAVPVKGRTSPSAPTNCSASKCEAPTAWRSAALTTSR